MVAGVLTGEQIRAGRAFARLDQARLAQIAGISLETVKRLERIQGPVDATTRTVGAIVAAFQHVGIEFEVSADGEFGVRKLARPGARRTSGPARPPRLSDGEIYRLIYVSRATPETVSRLDHEMQQVLAVSLRRNAELEITGALLACDGCFLQALEGRREAVRQIYGAIAEDHRHRDLRIVQRKAVSARQFPDWRMCIAVISPDDRVIREDLGMASGFRPEDLSPASALGLLMSIRPEMAAA